MTDNQQNFTRREYDLSRLERIEKKIDQLSEAMIILARTDEKLNAYDRNIHEHIERFRYFEEKEELAKRRVHDRIDAMEKKVDENSITVKTIQKLFWLIFTAVVTSAAGQLFLYIAK